MRLRIALDGREREVRVEGDPPDVRVTLDGRTVPVHVEVDHDAVVAEVDGRQIRLVFGGGVRIDGVHRTVRASWLAEDVVPEGASHDIEVRPPMPGRVVRILVRPGDAVRGGTPLMVLEAMKMQNEIPAPMSGVVRGVHVREGDLVTPLDPLVSLGPRP